MSSTVTGSFSSLVTSEGRKMVSPTDHSLTAGYAAGRYSSLYLKAQWRWGRTERREKGRVVEKEGLFSAAK